MSPRQIPPHFFITAKKFPKNIYIIFLVFISSCYVRHIKFVKPESTGGVQQELPVGTVCFYRSRRMKKLAIVLGFGIYLSMSNILAEDAKNLSVKSGRFGTLPLVSFYSRVWDRDGEKQDVSKTEVFNVAFVLAPEKEVKGKADGRDSYILSVAPCAAALFNNTPAPLEFSVQYTLSVLGKNILAAHSLALGMAVYF
jgi:hypothetical protein